VYVIPSHTASTLEGFHAYETFLQTRARTPACMEPST
jgi:hypothetical protein